MRLDSATIQETWTAEFGDRGGSRIGIGKKRPLRCEKRDWRGRDRGGETRSSFLSGGMEVRNSTVGAASEAAFRIARFFADFFLKKVRPAAGEEAQEEEKRQ